MPEFSHMTHLLFPHEPQFEDIIQSATLYALVPSIIGHIIAHLGHERGKGGTYYNDNGCGQNSFMQPLISWPFSHHTRIRLLSFTGIYGWFWEPARKTINLYTLVYLVYTFHILLYTPVYSCILLHTLVYSCILLYTRILYSPCLVGRDSLLWWSYSSAALHCVGARWPNIGEGHWETYEGSKLQSQP